MTTTLHCCFTKDWMRNQLRRHGPGDVLGRADLTLADALQLVDDVPTEHIPSGACDRYDPVTGQCLGHLGSAWPEEPSTETPGVRRKFGHEVTDVLAHMVCHGAAFPLRLCQTEGGAWGLEDQRGVAWYPYAHSDFDQRELCESVLSCLQWARDDFVQTRPGVWEDASDRDADAPQRVARDVPEPER